MVHHTAGVRRTTGLQPSRAQHSVCHGGMVQEEAARAKASLGELQDVHEKTQLAHTEIVKRLEQQARLKPGVHMTCALLSARAHPRLPYLKAGGPHSLAGACSCCTTGTWLWVGGTSRRHVHARCACSHACKHAGG